MCTLRVTRHASIRYSSSCLKARIIVAVNNIDAPMFTRVWQEFEYRIDVFRVTRGEHIENLKL
jgi:hypothetical protein